jgi:hypothetical protein
MKIAEQNMHIVNLCSEKITKQNLHIGVTLIVLFKYGILEDKVNFSRPLNSSLDFGIWCSILV